MGIIAETWMVDQRVQLKVQRLTGRHRLAGAILLGAPERGTALMFRDCRSLHGWFMRGALEAVFLDRDGRVLRVAPLRPWGARMCLSATHCLELSPGECARLGIAAAGRLEKISV
jgi:hypothetical protein